MATWGSISGITTIRGSFRRLPPLLSLVQWSNLVHWNAIEPSNDCTQVARAQIRNLSLRCSRIPVGPTQNLQNSKSPSWARCTTRTPGRNRNQVAQQSGAAWQKCHIVLPGTNRGGSGCHRKRQHHHCQAKVTQSWPADAQQSNMGAEEQEIQLPVHHPLDCVCAATNSLGYHPQPLAVCPTLQLAVLDHSTCLGTPNPPLCCPLYFLAAVALSRWPSRPSQTTFDR
mmetsp:Transcript_29467/g.66600  ORF Transcript_29467/g.66600 Transcript_29467/m.66600 type:complete len:227 (-) Transcript_29467:1420-2100(-)